jgi:CRISPR-associated endoribonuclease Cas6
MTTLHALVIKLIAQRAGVLPGSVGELSHAAFYAAVQAVDPVLSAQMHEAQNRSAFSLSPLYGYWQSPQDRRIHVSQGQEGWLRLGLLDDRLFAVFIQHLLNSGRPAIRLGAIDFAITHVYGAPGSHPWVGYTTLDDLRALNETPNRWLLNFESPTAIRWGDADNGTRRVMLFPLPRMAIAGLRTRWDRLTGEQWGRDFEEWVERNIIVSWVKSWRTESFTFQRQSYVGGLGVLEYHLLDDREQANAVHFHRLLHLAFYTGIGYKTTHGLGQVRLVSHESEVNSQQSTA